MPEPIHLDLMASDGKPLRHKYFQQQGDPQGLVIGFPGDNYGVDGPLLYYPGQLLWESGWDTAWITYGYQSAAEPFNPLMIAGIMEECTRAVEILFLEREYQRLVLMGKSLGAVLVALLCQQMALPECTRAVYLTPPLGPMFNPVLLETSQKACLVLGTGDRFFDMDLLREVTERKDLRLVRVEDADHSMNVPGALGKSLEIMGQVTEEIIDFIQADTPR
jgi:predicted alpha/beta-hydrolase family hydrolase